MIVEIKALGGPTWLPTGWSIEVGAMMWHLSNPKLFDPRLVPVARNRGATFDRPVLLVDSPIVAPVIFGVDPDPPDDLWYTPFGDLVETWEHRHRGESPDPRRLAIRFPRGELCVELCKTCGACRLIGVWRPGELLISAISGRGDRDGD